VNDFCSNCRWWKPPDDTARQNPMGNCRFNPPTVFMVIVPAAGAGRIAQPGAPQQMSGSPAFLSAWPPVPPDGSCHNHGKLDTGVKT
jgi:hypothetical protein